MMPSGFSAFIGQEFLKAKLRDLIRAAGGRNVHAFPHILLCGPPEMGKSTFAHAIAGELEVDIACLDAASIEKLSDMATAMANLKKCDILLIQDIDLLNKPLQKALATCISDYNVDLNIGKGPGARTIKMPLQEFTLIATTAYPTQVDQRLGRWMIKHRVEPYSSKELAALVSFLARQRPLALDPDAASLIAEYCEGSVGSAQVILTRVFDYCRLCEKPQVTKQTVEECLIALGLKEEGNHVDCLEEKLQRMTGTEFEEYVASVFQKMGYAVEITQASGDHGIDLFLRKGNVLEVVQCKRWSAPVGEPVLRDFYGALFGVGARLGYLITTSSFTESARLFAEGKPIRLIDLEFLIKMAASRTGLN